MFADKDKCWVVRAQVMLLAVLICSCLKKNLKACKSSEHAPNQGGNLSKGLGGNIELGSNDKIPSWNLRLR